MYQDKRKEERKQKKDQIKLEVRGQKYEVKTRIKNQEPRGKIKNIGAVVAKKNIKKYFLRNLRDLRKIKYS